LIIVAGFIVSLDELALDAVALAAADAAHDAAGCR
jgi:hypothetical protein